MEEMEKGEAEEMLNFPIYRGGVGWGVGRVRALWVCVRSGPSDKGDKTTYL